ncbi:MAG: hypothetical protein WC564_00755 [Patescibacteria group bacterium]|jgi:hypothetical protein
MFGYKTDPRGINLDKEIEKTQQNSGTPERDDNLSQTEGMDVFGENNYNIPGHEDDERLSDKTQGYGLNEKFVPIEDVVDKDAEAKIYDQFGPEDPKNLSAEELADAKFVANLSYDAENEFLAQAVKKLDVTEFNRLFNFLEAYRQKNADSQDGKSFNRSMPKDIANLIRKVNDRKPMVEFSGNKYDSNGELVDSNPGKVSASSIKFTAPKKPKQENYRVFKN